MKYREFCESRLLLSLFGHFEINLKTYIEITKHIIANTYLIKYVLNILNKICYANNHLKHET